MVFCHHYALSTPPLVGWLLCLMFREMYSGVTVFFVLSGFLIYFRHSRDESLRKVSLIRYGFHRFSRIYPMYFLVVIATAICTWVHMPAARHVGHMLFSLFLQLSFLKGYSDTWKFVGVGQGWSLTPEVTFYALFPLMLPLIRRFGFLLVLLAVYLTGIGLYGLGCLLHTGGIFQPLSFMVTYTFFGRAGDFFAGMILARYVLSLPAERFDVRRGLPLWTLIGSAGLLIYLMGMGLLERPGVYSADVMPGAALNLFLLPPIICALLFGIITEHSLIAKALGSPLLVAMGASSYCFYLIHVGGAHGYLSINAAVETLHREFGYIIIALIAYLCWRFIEEPMRRLILTHPWFRSAHPAAAAV